MNPALLIPFWAVQKNMKNHLILYRNFNITIAVVYLSQSRVGDVLALDKYVCVLIEE
jgi:hypothetical protein